MTTGATPADLAARGIEVLRHEAEAVAHAADRLDAEAFGRAVDLLARCAGNVATTGAGTSGILARKLAATLTSTGTPAIYVHPSDALHGGLGVIGSQAIVIALSNSGETEELSALLPYLRSRHVDLIAIVGNLNSSLARAATVALEAFAAREAGPLDLVPTASSAVALAVGDALALSVMDVKGTTVEGFAANHPSGRLGRRLTLRVRDVMHGGAELPTAPRDASLLDVVSAISGGGLGAVVVLGDDATLAGIVTDGDLRRALERLDPATLAGVGVDELMTHEPVSVEADTMAFDALRLMEDRPSQISVLPVVDGARCVGMVRLHDLVRLGL